ncbi:MAG: hypothetical protein LUF92_02090 [Clostridiales bacterium]|nr:hypothetical protein [Clostridiales bacterium]
MKITRFTFVNVRSPFCTMDDLAAYTGKTKRYIRMVVAELRGYEERYGKYYIIGEGKTLLVNLLCFTDFWKYRTRLNDKNMKKTVPSYDPSEVARQIGLYVGDI